MGALSVCRLSDNNSEPEWGGGRRLLANVVVDKFNKRRFEFPAASPHFTVSVYGGVWNLNTVVCYAFVRVLVSRVNLQSHLNRFEKIDVVTMCIYEASRSIKFQGSESCFRRNRHFRMVRTRRIVINTRRFIVLINLINNYLNHKINDNSKSLNITKLMIFRFLCSRTKNWTLYRVTRVCQFVTAHFLGICTGRNKSKFGSYYIELGDLIMDVIIIF